MVKKSAALPRSLSKMTTSRHMPHMTSMGVSMRRRGSVKGPTLCEEALSSSRFSDR